MSSLWGSHCGYNGYKESLVFSAPWTKKADLWWQKLIASLWLLTNEDEFSGLTHPPSILYFSYDTFSRYYLNVLIRFRAEKEMSRLYDNWLSQVGMSISHLDPIIKSYHIWTPFMMLPLSAHHRFPWVYFMYSPSLSLARIWIRSKMSEGNTDVKHQMHGMFYIMKESQGWKLHRKRETSEIPQYENFHVKRQHWVCTIGLYF